jgi:(p)ppGpp synthase/HD superfamily hydrolase
MQLTGRYAKALRFAFSLHQQHERKGSGVPYMAHLMSVSSLVLEFGGDEDAAIAGLLHDAVEDQGGVEISHLIRKEFGDVVANIVDGCTDSVSDPKPPWRARKELYLQHLHQVPAATLLVSNCDKLHNARSIVSDLRTIGGAVWNRFSGGQVGSLWYYAGLSDVFTSRKAPAAADLAREVATMNELSVRG